MIWLRSLFMKPKALEVMERQLEDALRERAVAAVERERAVHTERMLQDRVDRLSRELGVPR